MKAGICGALFLCVAAGATASAADAGPSFTTAQAERGEAAYQHNCRTCHGDNLDDGDFGGAPLKGSWFRDHWGSGNVAALFNFTKTAMPPDRPGGLNDETYADIIAYLLARNDYKPAAQELPTSQDEQEKMSLQR